jgi:predicted nucleotidyltransferase component of viral defense system
MITIEELKIYKHKLNFNLGQVEKNYLHIAILFAISKLAPDKLMFKGGTALMLCHGLDRFSEDLDFNIVDENLDVGEILEKTKALLTDYNILIDYKIEENKFQDTYIYFYGPLYKNTNNTRCKMTIDFSRRNDYISKGTISKVNHIYNEFPVFYINTLDIKEILAEKVRAIITRKKARDIFDLYFLISKKTEIDLEIINKKLALYNETFNLKKFIEAIEEREKLWENELPQLILHVPDFKEATGEIISAFKKSFS